MLRVTDNKSFTTTTMINNGQIVGQTYLEIMCMFTSLCLFLKIQKQNPFLIQLPVHQEHFVVHASSWVQVHLQWGKWSWSNGKPTAASNVLLHHPSTMIFPSWLCHSVTSPSFLFLSHQNNKIASAPEHRKLEVFEGMSDVLPEETVATAHSWCSSSISWVLWKCCSCSASVPTHYAGSVGKTN